MGLKTGIYSTPWITSYAHHPGGSADNAEGGAGRNRRQRQERFVNRRPSRGTWASTVSPTHDAKQWADVGIRLSEVRLEPDR